MTIKYLKADKTVNTYYSKISGVDDYESKVNFQKFNRETPKWSEIFFNCSKFIKTFYSGFFEVTKWKSENEL